MVRNLFGISTIILKTMRKIRPLLELIWLVAIGFVEPLCACALEPFEIAPLGELYEISLGGADETSFDPTTSIPEVYFYSPGNSSHAVSLLVEGPPGTQVVIDGVRLPVGVSLYPDALTSELAVEPATLLGLENSSAYNAGRFFIDSNNSTSGVQLLYQLHKDACLPGNSYRYISRIRFIVNEVAPSYFSQGFKLRVAAKEYRYSGPQIASIKPVAEGVYRGEPIVLMGTIQFGGESINIIRRARGRVTYRRNIPIVKYVYHRGRALSLARLGRLLTGGRATFELTNGGYVYGVCFSLVRRRQLVNGYPL
jgi:hypothetical protein